ncbi:MAG: hypothetical protein OIF35_05870 [Cellvibrionaceae bacterium]|nr:hypothetical protein [Cellvibrionaceae bacterium]
MLSAKKFKSIIAAVAATAALGFTSVSAQGACQYYSFLDYTLDGHAEKVYRASGVRMYAPGLRVAYSPKGHTRKDGFVINRLGPYSTPAEAKQVLNEHLSQLRKQGYRKQSDFKFPRIFLLNKRHCHVS